MSRLQQAGRDAIRVLEEVVDTDCLGSYQSQLPELLRGILSARPSYEYVDETEPPIVTIADIRAALDEIERAS